VGTVAAPDVTTAGGGWWGGGEPPDQRWPGVTIRIDDVRGRYRFDAAAADRVCRWFPKYCSHSKGEFNGAAFDLLAYQAQLILRPLFGWISSETGLRRFRKAYIEIPKKNGKALALDTPIPTPQGWTTMGDLVEGSVVFDEAGVPTRVSWASPVMTGRPCYRLAFSDGSTIIADAEHQWVTRTLKPEGRRGVVTTDQIATTLLRRDGARNHSIDVHGPLCLPDVDLPIPPYALGVWLGDGHSNAAAISGHRADLVIIDEIEQAGLAVGRVRYRDGRHPDVFHASRIAGMQRQLRRAGLLGHKHIPLSYLRASDQQRMALLQGVMDADGYCSKAGQCELVTVSARLRDDYLELIRSLGFKPSVVTDRARYRGKDCGERYRIQFWSWADRPVFRLPRKCNRLKARPNRRQRSSTIQIVACDPVQSVPVKCITVESPSSLYLAGRSMIQTHNTQLIAGLALYMLLADQEPGAEVYVAAADRDQARILFRAAVAMVEANPSLKDRVVVYRNQIVKADDPSAFFQVLSAEAATKHGPNIHCLIIDELHAQPNRELFETLTRGVIARRQPLIMLITTAGDDDESICAEEYDYAKKVLSGTIDDERHLPVIFEADKDADWLDPSVWHQVNPALGDTIQESAIAGFALEAQNEPRKRNDFLRYHLNRWVNQATAWIPIEWWDACQDETPDADLVALDCAAGLDLAQKIDLAAFVVAFRRMLDGSVEQVTVTEKDEASGEALTKSIDLNYEVFVRAWFWIPEETMREHERTDGIPYSEWARAAFVTVTEGASIDYSRIYRDITTEILPRFPKLKQGLIGYDPAFATDIAQQLRDRAGLKVHEVLQNYTHMNEPCYVTEALIKSRRVHHDGHRTLRNHWENVAVKHDDARRIRPVKPKKRSKHIDGVVATLMALKGLMLMPPRGKRKIGAFVV